MEQLIAHVFTKRNSFTRIFERGWRENHFELFFFHRGFFKFFVASVLF